MEPRAGGGGGGHAGSKKPRSSCSDGSSMPGLTSLFSGKLVGDLIACGAGGGRGGGLDSFGTLRVALGGVFEGEAACASAIEI